MRNLIDLKVAGRIATVTLNRPPVNAFNAEMFTTFHAILDDLGLRSDWSVLHIRSGLEVFSAGADLAEISTRFSAPDKMEAAAKTTRPFQELFQRISDLPQVSLAEIGGAAMGGGYELALGCDLRLTDPKRKWLIAIHNRRARKPSVGQAAKSSPSLATGLASSPLGWCTGDISLRLT